MKCRRIAPSHEAPEIAILARNAIPAFAVSIFFGRASLQHAVSQFMAHYHTERNHQGLENRLVQPQRITVTASAQVVEKHIGMPLWSTIRATLSPAY
jgi:hypothetical protein